MSLLLDALKKAADDKEKNSRESAADESNRVVDNSSNNIEVEELSLQDHDDINNTDEKSSVVVESNNEELRLDDVDTNQNNSIVEHNLDSPVEEDDLRLEAEKTTSTSKIKSDKSEYVISDDALSLLIYKTNRDVKRGKKVLLSSLFIATLFIIISGGVYYYVDMEAEIDALERKHRIAMLAMRSKTNKEKTPEKTEIIRNLVSDADLEEKVKNARLYIENEKLSAKRVEVKPANVKLITPELSIKRTNKIDPVAKTLNDAWLAYEDAEYMKAQQLYKKVLAIEGNNRDALLGIGAIAVVEKNHVVARDAYLKLLNLDPRDPIATAALAGLNSDKSSLAADEKYLLAMLKKNPDAPHLNFALGNVYAQSDKWSAAQQRYFSAWQQDSENADYVFNLAVSMDQLSKQKQAIDLYKKSLIKASNKQVSFSREAVQKRINELTRL